MNHYREATLRSNRRLVTLGAIIVACTFGLAYLIGNWLTIFSAGFATGIFVAMVINWRHTRRELTPSEEVGVFAWTCPDCEGRNFSEGPPPKPGETVSCSECEFDAQVGSVERE